MLPPSSTLMSRGPRRTANVAPLFADLPPLLSRTNARARMSAIAPKRRRGCLLAKAEILFWFGIGDLLPLTVLLDVENSRVHPELEPGDGMADEGLGALIFRADEIILRVHLVLGFGATEFGEQVLLFDSALGEFDTNLVDLIVSFGLVERPPTVAHLQFDLVLLLFHGALGLFLED